MKICVLIKEVPDASALRRIDPATRRLQRGASRRLSPYDAHALEAALRLRESGWTQVKEIVAVTMGPEAASQTLHRAAALGADRAVHVTDLRLAGSDVNGTAYALAAALARERADLLLTGQQSDDGQCFVVPAAIAAHLGMACVTQATRIGEAGDRTLRIERQGDSGNETLDVALPAVISVTESINEPRYPSLQGIVGAKSKPREVLSADDLKLDVDRVGQQSARAECFAFAEPAERAPARVIEDGDPAAAVAEILRWFESRGVAP